MRAYTRRRHLLLSTATLIGALSGYGRGAYAACAVTVSPNAECSGANVTAQNINLNNATVTTVPGFSVITPNNNGVRITGAGALSFTDANASTITSSNTALAVIAGATGDVTVDTNGALTGGQTGLNAQNSNAATGSVTVTTNGDVTGTSNRGIFARSGNVSANLSVTTGAGTTVTGANQGINADSRGSGDIDITANGNVTATGGTSQGIVAQNRASGNDFNLTTAVDTTVMGGNRGIRVTARGAGATTITLNGDVTGDNLEGINAQNNSGTDLNLTTGAGTTIMGGNRGIRVRNNGAGALTVTANGDVVEGTSLDGIYARNTNSGTSIRVTTGANSDVTGGNRGIFARSFSADVLEVIANGDVTGTSTEGIHARNGNNGTNLSVTTGADRTVMGGARGIRARHYGTGTVSVTANGDVIGTSTDGIYARNRNGTDISVTTGAGTTVMGGARGIRARNQGSGALDVTANGVVTGTTNQGIYARNLSGTDLSVTTGANSTVTGGNQGIYARQQGAGTLTINANGAVTGTNNDGIFARQTAGPIDIKIGSESVVTSNGLGGDDFAIDIEDGPGDVTVAGRLNGGTGGAFQFDQGATFDNRMELHTTATINGNVFAGSGANDTLAFGGTGDGDFDLSDIDTGGNTEQYRAFEIFQVESATWTLDGITSADFIVEGGTVRGTGTFGDLTVNGGTLAPGPVDAFGTMTVSGSFSLNAGATYEVKVDAAGQNDKVMVTDAVNLTGATLRVLAANGNYDSKAEYVIIDNDGADPVNGVFAKVKSNLAFLAPTVFYNGGTGNDVVLRLERNATQFSDVAQTPNQKAVAGALDKFRTGNGLFLAVVNQTAAGARQAFDALSGEIHATLTGVLADDSHYVREAILGRLVQAGHASNALGAAGPQVASLDSSAMALGYGDKSLAPPPPPPVAFWTEAYGAWGDFDGNRNAATADRDLGGFVSGIDAGIGGTWRAGFAAGASYSSIDVNDRNSSADVDSFLFAGYAGGMVGAFALRGGGAWAWSEIDTSRAVIFPGFFERQKASYDADTGQIFGEIAYPTTMGGMAVEPFAGLAYVSVDTDSFRERGGDLASLSGTDTDQDVGYSTLGLRAATTMHWGGTLVTPHISAAWQHAFDDVTPGAALAFASTGIGFNVTGVPLAQNSALIDAGLDFAVGANTSAGVSYSGQFGDGVQDNAVKGRLTWLF